MKRRSAQNEAEVAKKRSMTLKQRCKAGEWKAQLSRKFVLRPRTKHSFSRKLCFVRVKIENMVGLVDTGALTSRTA